MTKVKKRSLLCAALLAALVLLVLPSIAAADTTVTVTGTSDSTSGTCTTTMTGTSCTTLRAAILDVTGTSGGGTVELGTDQTYAVTQGVIDPTDENPVTVVGNGSTINLANNGDSGFFEPSAAAEFENLTVENASGSDIIVFDGQSGPLTLSQVVFSHDSANTEVAGNVGLTLTGVSFVDDTDQDAVTVARDSPSIENTFDDVSFSDETGESLQLGGESSTINDMSVVGGNAENRNAVEVDAQGPVSIDGLSISGVTGSYLGALNLDASSTVDDLSITDTQGQNAPVFINAAVTGQNWTVADNTSSAASTSPGGGIEAYAGTLKLTFATLDGNSDSGAADELYATDNSTIDIGDSIITGSSAGGAAQCAVGSGSAIVSTGYNLDQAGGCGFAATGDENGVNPLLGSLATSTSNQYVGTGSYPFTLTYAPLEYASPAVGVVPKADCSGMTDELGDSRPQGPSGCDAGAYESPVTEFSLTQSGAPATATAGTSVTYTLSATNASPTTPQHAVITDSLPAGATLASATVSLAGAAPVACTGTTTISCPVGPLGLGKQAVATITATLNSPGVNVNAAYVSSEYPDVDDAKGTASASTQVSAPVTAPTSTSPTTTAPITTTPSTATPSTLVLSGVKLTPARFASRAKATLVFTASTAGSLTATVIRSEPGVKSGKSCVAPPKHGKAKPTKCTRSVTVARFTVAAKAGANTLALPAKVRDLAPGTYHLTIATRTLAFTVTKPTPAHRKHEVRS